MSGDSIRTRGFVVGSARSGTTLVQSMLAAHPEVFSFPESHYFRKMWGRRWSRRRWGVVPPRAAAATLDELGRLLDIRPPDLPTTPRWWPFAGRWGRSFAPAVDAAALRAGASVWVEKTPTHIHCLEQIDRWVVLPRVVHVIRDGREVVASLYALCQSDPGQWVRQFVPAARGGTGVPADAVLIPAIVDYWNVAARITEGLSHRPGHHVVVYEALVTYPERELDRLCEFIAIDRRDEMLRFWEAADAVVGWRREKVHMQGAFEQRLREPAERFTDTFDEPTRATIEARLHRVHL